MCGVWGACERREREPGTSYFAFRRMSASSGRARSSLSTHRDSARTTATEAVPSPSRGITAMPAAVEVLDGIGAIAIALAAAICGGIAQAWESPLATCTILGCAAILMPFLVVASIATGLGVVCCAPIAVGGIACAYVPALARQLAFMAIGLTARLLETPTAVQLRSAAVANPGLALFAAGGLIAASPLILVVGAIGLFWYLLLAPLTVPLTALLLYNRISSLRPGGGLVASSPPPTKRARWDGSLYSGYCGSGDGCSTLGSSSMRTGPSGHAHRRAHDCDCAASDALTSPPPSEFAESQATGAGADDFDDVREPPRARRANANAHTNTKP